MLLGENGWPELASLKILRGAHTSPAALGRQAALDQVAVIAAFDEPQRSMTGKPVERVSHRSTANRDFAGQLGKRKVQPQLSFEPRVPQQMRIHRALDHVQL